MVSNFRNLIHDYPVELLIVIALSLGILWFIMYQRIQKCTILIEEQKGRINFLESELEACRLIKVSDIQAQTTLVDASSNLLDDLSKGIKKDDLKIVEGIGPKIEALLFDENIFTFEQLSKTEVSKIKKILDAAGSRYQMHDPTTWPDQAALARDDKWDELKKWQAELNKGRLS